MINTGAKLPDSASAVIQIEDTQVHEWHPKKINDTNEKSIRILTECSMNQDVRYVENEFEDKIYTKNHFLEILEMM